MLFLIEKIVIQVNLILKLVFGLSNVSQICLNITYKNTINI